MLQALAFIVAAAYGRRTRLPGNEKRDNADSWVDVSGSPDSIRIAPGPTRSHRTELAMKAKHRMGRWALLLAVLALVVAACGGDDDDGGEATTSAGAATGSTVSGSTAAPTGSTAAPTGSTTGSSEAAGGVPSWCGPEEIVLGMTDGFGGNSWRLVTTASAREEAAKCPSVTSFEYADGQGDTQKAISDIQGMVATGVDALVVFPDAGEAILPALRSAYEAGVVTVPYRVFPGGEDGVDYDLYVNLDARGGRPEVGQLDHRELPRGGHRADDQRPPGQQPGNTRGGRAP